MVSGKKPYVGARVHYVLDAPLAGQCRAADVVRVVGEGREQRVNLLVLFDGPNDQPVSRTLTRYIANVEEDQRVHRNGTWHFIEDE